jgi:hypothetical protein
VSRSEKRKIKGRAKNNSKHQPSKEILQWSKHFRNKGKIVESKVYHKNHHEPYLYKFNNQGFRSKDFEVPEKNCYLALGGSDTFGTGNLYEDLWHQQLSKLTNTTIYNLGIGGGSSDTIARLLSGWIEHIKPTKVFIAWPPMARWELFLEDRIKILSVGSISDERFESNKDFNEDYMKHYMLNDNNSIMNFYKNKIFVQALCDKFNIKLYQYYLTDIQSEYKNSFARDNSHAGVDLHTRIAKDFYNLLEE